jgi:hypothetical protein
MSNPALAGKQYEVTLRNKLKSVFKNIPKNAGFGSGPDLTIPSVNNPGQTLLVEAKTTTQADFGQKAITFNGTSWVAKFDGTEPQSIVSLYNYLYSQYDVDRKIQQSWGLPNDKLTAVDLQNIINNSNLSKVLYYEKLLIEKTGSSNPFPQTTLASGPDIVSKIISYYNSKGIYYIQIKNEGFYILGSDKMGLNSKLPIDIPRFAPSSASLIVRGKTSSSNKTFRPTLTLKSEGVARSNFSLDDANDLRLLRDSF